MKYRKKPIVIEAFRYLAEEPPNWFLSGIVNGLISVNISKESCTIKTLEGNMSARRGDWIIKGTANELYPCKNKVFEDCYELVGEE